MRIEIPLPMPTWNRILAMHPWQRMALRHYLHHAVSMSITYGTDWPTQMVYQSKPCSTELWRQEYFQLIRPNPSRKLLIAKLKGKSK